MQTEEQIIVTGSRLILALRYDRIFHDLTVFMVSGATYNYGSVPVPVWEEFVNAPSKGQFYNLRIKGKYPLKGK